MMHKRFLIASVATAVSLSSLAGADDDHDRARQAVEAGDIVSLRDILEIVERDYPGDLMEVELEREDGRWIYEVEILAPDGRLLELEYDARSKALIDMDAQEKGRAD